ncbi:MAG: hypothetical protein FJX54_24710, partial [Alphaproteobacteria bacterium]|nr:hypothetical protein [Alphaproteobacteria bacterium]
DTIMLGGLIREAASKSNSGIPILHEIPGIGVLFGQKAKTASRTELVVMIRPIIVSNPDQARNVTQDLKQKFLTLLQREQTGITQPRRIVEKE